MIFVFVLDCYLNDANDDLSFSIASQGLSNKLPSPNSILGSFKLNGPSKFTLLWSSCCARVLFK